MRFGFPGQTTLPNVDMVVALMRREIDRFVQAARVRSEFDTDTRRRAMRRYHRSWPLLIGDLDGGEEISAALHNASAGGIGFLCDRAFPQDELLLIKLFWHENSSLRIPAAVVHASPYRRVMLIGCRFALDKEDACRAGFRAQRWYD